MKRYFLTFIGCLLIALTYNIFVIPNNLVADGVFGIGALFNYQYNLNPAIVIGIINFIILIIAFLFIGKKALRYLFPTLLIPLLIYLLGFIESYIIITNIDLFLIVLITGLLIGVGASLIFKEGFSPGGFEALQDVFNTLLKYQNKYFIYSVDIIIICIAFFVIPIEIVIYSLILILIIKYVTTRFRLGISAAKTFLIITTKTDEVKDYIINELNQDLTELNVKGGFTNDKNKIIMTVVNTKNYYRLKEGIKHIDDHVFITIVDNYEVINKNKKFNK